jgi:predicted small lipoprotein YifL
MGEHQPGAMMSHVMTFKTISLLLLVSLGLAACGGPATTEPPEDNLTSGEATEVPAQDTDTADAEHAQEDGEPVAKDHTIIPGERIGPVTSETSRDELADIYGEEKLTDQPIAMGEGTTEPGTLVDLGPDQQFAIVWRDATQAEPLLAKDFGSAWQTPEGLGVGVPYATVKSVLGNFQLYGFAWDYEGSLVLEGSNLDQYYGDLLLRVRPSQESVEAHPKEYQAVMGDALFAGDDPNLNALDIEVYDMTIYLNSLTGE